MAKSNVSSIRYSDEIKDIIEEQEGNTFSEKFHNLVLYCYKELPKLKQELDYLQEKIIEKKNEFDILKDKFHTLSVIKQNFEVVNNMIKESFKKIEKL